MASVPNWIAKAVILTPSYGGHIRTAKTTGWRATRTQVIVNTKSGERRFRLDTLTEVGDPHYGSMRTRLAEPSDPEIVAARSKGIISAARGDVQLAVERARLQDSGKTAEETTAALLAIRDTVNAALASLTEVL
jgi:hypothetical protein